MAPALAALMRAEWPDWYGPAGPGDAAADLAARDRAEGLPMGFVALLDGVPVGTAALDATSHGAAPGEAPWLTGLLTAPARRGTGVASALVLAAEAEARAAGATALYATTIGAAGLLQRLGWQGLREMPDGYRVLRKSLAGL